MVKMIWRNREATAKLLPFLTKSPFICYSELEKKESKFFDTKCVQFLSKSCQSPEQTEVNVLNPNATQIRTHIVKSKTNSHYSRIVFVLWGSRITGGNGTKQHTGRFATEHFYYIDYCHFMMRQLTPKDNFFWKIFGFLSRLALTL